MSIKNYFCIIFVFSSFSFINGVLADDSVLYNNLSVGKVVDEYIRNKEFHKKTELCTIMTHYGSDKGSGWHNYTTLYFKLFSRFKNSTLNLFELGIGSNDPNIPSNMGINGSPGASLYGWSNFLPLAKIYGADIDRKCLFENNKIKTFYCDQCDEESISEMFNNADLLDVQFDIIIDDGLHVFNANKTFLINSIQKLKKGGVFIIEDLSRKTGDEFRRILPVLKESYDLDYIEVVDISSKINSHDNRLLLIQK